MDNYPSGYPEMEVMREIVKGIVTAGMFGLMMACFYILAVIVFSLEIP